MISMLEYYFPQHYDNRGGGVTLTPDPVVGSLSVGKPRPISTPINVDDEDSCDDEDDFDIVDQELAGKFLSKIGTRSPRSDSFSMSRTNHDNYRYSLEEKQMHARKGISPFPMQKFSGPALGGHAVKMTTHKPKLTGTMFGWSKGHIDLSELMPELESKESETEEDILDSYDQEQASIEERINKINIFLDLMENHKKTDYL